MTVGATDVTVTMMASPERIDIVEIDHRVGPELWFAVVIGLGGALVGATLLLAAGQVFVALKAPAVHALISLGLR